LSLGFLEPSLRVLRVLRGSSFKAHRRPHQAARTCAIRYVSASPRPRKGIRGKEKDMASALDVRRTFDLGGGKTGQLHSLPELEKQGLGAIARLPTSLRIVLESLVRNCDGKRVSEADV